MTCGPLEPTGEGAFSVLPMPDAPKVVGFKQSLRAIRDGRAAVVYLADDAADKVRSPIVALCKDNGLAVTAVAAMDELGQACGIDIAASVAVVLTPQE